ncbi:MAG: GntR family transcriptional regulator [Pseudomonadota bacterium]
MRPGEKIVPIRDQIADQLRSDIIAGELAPGTKLNEQGLATRFGVSRGPIRDVLLQLTKEGLLVTRSNVGASVSEMLSPELQSLMVDIRRRIESHAAKQLKGLMTDEDFEALDYILDQFQTAFETRDFTAVTKADIEFHKYLVEKAGGQELVNLWYPVVLRMRMNYKRIDSPEDGVDEHRAIVDALRADDTRRVTAALKANIR